MFQSNKYTKSAIIIFSFLLSGAIYFYIAETTASAPLQSIKLVQIYGLISIAYLMLVMLSGPLYKIYPNFPLKSFYRSALGGLGISTFYFAFLHSYIGFFSLLKGFQGLSFLDITYLLSNLFGFIALVILAVMAGTSFTWAMKKLGKKWKTIHRFVYLAGIGLVLHPIMIGSSFRDFTKPLALIFILAFTVLMVFESISTYRYLTEKFPNISSRIWTGAVSAVFIGSFYLLFLLHQMITGRHFH